VQVSAEIPADLPAAYVDAQQIGMAPGNLVTNAYQAMPEGGRLTLSAGAEQESVVLSVADTGRGIPPEHVAKLFGPLFTTKARGIGLGLALSRGLVEANGESVQTESKGEPGKGW
jgi:signal transduction histidine kinase